MHKKTQIGKIQTKSQTHSRICGRYCGHASTKKLTIPRERLWYGSTVYYRPALPTVSTYAGLLEDHNNFNSNWLSKGFYASYQSSPRTVFQNTSKVELQYINISESVNNTGDLSDCNSNAFENDQTWKQSRMIAQPLLLHSL